MSCNIYNIQAKSNTAFHRIFHMHFTDKEFFGCNPAVLIWQSSCMIITGLMVFSNAAFSMVWPVTTWK